MENQEIGFCYECQTKNGDSSKKTVYRCDVCGKWFCELHLKPKFPYFVDWETQFDVQGNPAVKAMFYSEYGRQDGHPDFRYLREKIRNMEDEKKRQDEQIKANLDRMMESGRLRRKNITPIWNNQTTKKPQSRRQFGRFSITVGRFLAYFLLALLVGGLFAFIGISMTSSISISQTESDIFNGINSQRANMGLPVLGNDSSLTLVSNQWSNQLVKVDSLTHGDFDGRMESIGLPDYTYSCGEIIGSFQSGSVNGIPDTNSASALANEFVNMWLNSPEHRAIMLTDCSGYMGVGLSRNGSTFYGVVDFKFAGDIQSPSNPQPDGSGSYTITVPPLPTPNTNTFPTPANTLPPTADQNSGWSSYGQALKAGSQYTIIVTGNQGYSFDSYRYVTSTHMASTEIRDAQSTLSVSGDMMTLNAYFAVDQTNPRTSASITIIPTTNIQLDLEVRYGTAIVNSLP